MAKESPIVRDMRMSSAQPLGEMGASSRGGSLHLGFHSHLQACTYPSCNTYHAKSDV